MRDSSLQDRLLGGRLAHYEIQRLLGQGGMGEVFAATDLRLRRQVALKVVRQAGQREALDRFVQEARFAAQLNHPNVVTIYEVNRADDLVYIAMEFMDAGSIQQLLDESGPLSWDVATRVVMRVCRGLEAAHARGLIHRDVKPGNILRNRRGDIKLTDFGLAKSTNSAALARTSPGMALGTPLFMSPEQCQGEQVDARSDMYSLGATFFALLTGRPPFEGKDSFQVAFAHCGSPVPDPRALRPELPEAATSIIQRAMAKRPSDRYQSVADLIAELKSVFNRAEPKSGTVEVGWPPSAVRSRARVPNLRNHRVSAVIGVCLLLALGWSSWHWFAATPQTSNAGGQPVAASVTQAEDEPSSKSAKHDDTPANRLPDLVAAAAPGEMDRLIDRWRAEQPQSEGFRLERTARGPTGVDVQVVSHRIDGERHFGMLRFPQPSGPNQSLPVLLLVHAGRDSFEVQQVIQWRRVLPILDQYLVVIPAFRGRTIEGGFSVGRHVSDGRSLGLHQDARDTLALLECVLKAMPLADAKRIAVFGPGAGASLALQVAARDRRVQAVLAVSDDTGFLVAPPAADKLADVSSDGDLSNDLGPIADEVLRPFLSGTLTFDEARERWLGWSATALAKSLPRTQLHIGSLPDKPWVDSGRLLESHMRTLGRQRDLFECFHYESDPTAREAMRSFRPATSHLLEDIANVN